MAKNTAKINWDEIINKFNSYNGTITEFCKQNQISIHQLYYRRKKTNKQSEPIFHCLNIVEESDNKPTVIDQKTNLITDIKIEIGKATIYVKRNDQIALANIIKELSKLC